VILEGGQKMQAIAFLRGPSGMKAIGRETRPSRGLENWEHAERLRRFIAAYAKNLIPGPLKNRRIPSMD
jgi:hypothetical protein